MTKIAALIAGALLACQDPAPARDAGETLRQAASLTRSQKGYEAEFKTRMQAVGDPLKTQGKVVWTSPGLLAIHATASGGDDKKIVRTGDTVWVYHALQGSWFDAVELGLDSAARGIQNPDEVLDLVSRNPGEARFASSGDLQVTLTGQNLANVVRNGGFAWNRSTATATLSLDKEGRIQSVRFDATLVNGANGNVQYEGEVAFSFPKELSEPAFVDEKNRPILLSAEMKKAIEALKARPR